MERCLKIGCGMMAAALLTAVAAWGASDSQAEELMAAVRGSMPDVPLELEASIHVVEPNGRTRNSIRAEAL